MRLALRPLLAVPVGGFEAVLGARRLGAEQPVVPVEAVASSPSRCRRPAANRGAAGTWAGRQLEAPGPLRQRRRRRACGLAASWPAPRTDWFTCVPCSVGDLARLAPLVADALHRRPCTRRRAACRRRRVMPQVLQQAVVHAEGSSRGCVTFWPRLQASTITVLTATLTTCSATLSSHSASARASSGRHSSITRWRSRTSWMWRIQLSARPMRVPPSAACTPAQP